MASKVPLEQSWLFEGLPAAVLEKIGALASEERFEAGTTIFSEGDPARQLYVLAEGEVELTYTLPGGSPLVVRIAHVTPGELFGWSALARGEKLTADAKALTESSAYLIPAGRLLEIMDCDPPSGYRVMARLSELIAKRLRDTRTELRWLQSSV